MAHLRSPRTTSCCTNLKTGFGWIVTQDLTARLMPMTNFACLYYSSTTNSTNDVSRVAIQLFLTEYLPSIHTYKHTYIHTSSINFSDPPITRLRPPLHRLVPPPSSTDAA